MPMEIKKPITKKYLSAWEALYTNKSQPATGAYAKAKALALQAVVRPKVPSEALEQKHFVQMVKNMGLPIIAIPNGARRSVNEGARLKSQGLMSGAPDLFIPVAKGSYHGLFVEMKITRGGVVSQLQKECIAMLNKNGYLACVARGCDEAMEILRKYLNESTPKVL